MSAPHGFWQVDFVPARFCGRLPWDFYQSMFGSIEAGGTKFVCGVGTGPADLKTMQFPTTLPAATLATAIEFLRDESRGELKAVGIGSFGPIDLHSTSLTFGYVTSTPKAGWQNYNLAGTVRDALGVPVGFDTDVDAAALGEARWGAAQNLTSFTSPLARALAAARSSMAAFFMGWCILRWATFGSRTIW